MVFKRKAMRAFLICGLLALLVAGSGLALAQDETGYPDLPAFADFVKQGGTVAPIGRAGSLEGFALVTAEGGLKTVYVTPERTMVMGILVDAAGKNLTADQLSAYRDRLEGGQSALPGADKGTSSKAEQVYAAAEKAAWVAAGDAKAPYVYMFMNVNCPHCQAAIKDLAPHIAAGRIQVRLVPYGAAEANRTGGAALLSVKDPLAAWLSYAQGTQAALDAHIGSAADLEKIAANTSLVNTLHVPGPPFILYRRPVDGAVTALVGQPKNPLALVADLLPPPPLSPAPEAQQKPETQQKDAAP